MDDRSGWQVKNQNRYKQELIWWKVRTKTIIKHIFIRININFMQSRGFLLSLWMSMLLSLCPNIDDSVQSIHAVVNRFRNTKLISSVLEWNLKVMFCISSASKLETHFLSFVICGIWVCQLSGASCQPVLCKICQKTIIVDTCIM